MNTYKQGHDKHSTSSHEKRTPESDAAFLLPHIKPTDHILDVGCGPGTITTGFTRYATQGHIIGIDLSTAVLEKASQLALAARISADLTSLPCVTFQPANVLEGLPFPDDTFDIVYASQVLGHIPLPRLPVVALTEMRRVLKPSGILALRDAVDSTSYPLRLGLDTRFFAKQWYVLQRRRPGDESVASSMLALCRAAGFDVDGGKVRLAGGGTVFQGEEERKWMAERMKGMLSPGSALFANWIDAGYDAESIADAVKAVEEWADTPDAWYLAVQCETMARK